MGICKFKYNVPFNFFSCGRVGHYFVKRPYNENHDNEEKRKIVPKKNVKRSFVCKKSLYTHEYNEFPSDDEDDNLDSDQQ